MKYNLLSLLLMLCFCSSCLLDQPPPVEKTDAVEFTPEEAQNLALKYNLEACQEGAFSGAGKLTRPFCKCLVPKLLENFADGSAEMTGFLETGVPDPVMEEDRLIMVENMKDCLESVGLKDDLIKQMNAKNNWPPEVIAGMKRAFVKSLEDSDADEPEEVDRFCDCMIGEVQKKYEVSDILNGAAETAEYEALMDSCYLQALKPE